MIVLKVVMEAEMTLTERSQVTRGAEPYLTKTVFGCLSAIHTDTPTQLIGLLFVSGFLMTERSWENGSHQADRKNVRARNT